MMLSAIALGQAMQVNNGFYQRVAIVWLTLALVLCGAGVLAMRLRPGTSGRAARIGRGVAAAGLSWQLFILFVSEPGISIPAGTSLRFFQAGILLQVVAIGAGLAGVAATRRIWFPALLAITLALGIWMVNVTPAPRIDVVVVHKEAIDALGSGQNPYRINFADIYGPESGFYGSSKVVDGRVMFGFPYPPVSLLAAAPGQWLAHDYRYAEVVAFVLGAALIGAAQPGWLAKAAAALLLTTPRLYFVFDQGWSEPIAVLALGVAVWTLSRHSRLAAVAAALLMVTKQYLALGAIAVARALIAAGEFGGPRFWAGVAVASAVTVPFFVWNPSAFFDAMVLLQMREPFRPDSLSYLSFADRLGLGHLSRVWSVAAALLAVSVATICTPRTAAGVAASLAISCLAMFAFGSKAFCNYYFFVVAALCATVAATPEDPTA